MNTPFSRFSEYFIAVARTGSLRKAADQLFISVSAVHRQIALAEEELGIVLFERLPSGLKLTLAGELLYADVLKWQKEFQQTRIRFDEIQGLTRGTIEFGLISALSDGFVMQSVQYMYQNYPWINFNIRVADSEVIARKIIDAELDFGLILNPKAHQHLEVVHFLELPLGFVMGKSHPLAEVEKIYFSDTLSDNHFIPAEPLIIHDYVQAMYKHHKFIPARKTESNDIRLMNNLIKANTGIGILSYLDVFPELEREELIFKPILDKGLHPLTIALCVAPKRQISRVSQLMIKNIIEQMEDLKSKVKDIFCA
ncbi:LysR family transcriptional regulator [Acinetobacter sp. ANC 4282]|uniref:LysR family transcriptional regulator n=1 Tax=Acinetobacter terrae TaxID=2731247 RepID=UPI0014905AC2|nr:LysR family transcriptional regulator [Acinetobacter terrae]NNH17336.1 LysR family transcriptional regulator [Acinetobacter terrae]